MGLQTKQSFELIKNASQNSIDDIIDEFNDLTIQANLSGMKIADLSGEFKSNLAPAMREILANNPNITLEELQTKLKGVQESSVAAAHGSQMLGTALNTLTTFAIAAAVTFVVQSLIELAGAFDKVKQATKEFSDGVIDTEKDLDEYKAKIKELQDKLNDSSTSYSDARSAREQLLSIQDELISKYGSEAESIDLVTQAINGNIDAIDQLSEKKYRQAVNDFDNQNLTGKWDWAVRRQYGARTNSELAQKIMENDKGIEIHFRNEDFDEIQKLKSLYGGEISVGEYGGSIKFTDQLDDLYDKLLDIQSVAQGLDVSNAFLDSLDIVTTRVKENNEQFSDAYNLQLKYNVLNGQYANQQKELSNIYADYRQAVIDNDEKLAETYKNSLYEKLQDFKADITFNPELSEKSKEGLTNFVDNLYPEFESEFAQKDFKLKIDTEFDYEKIPDEVLNYSEEIQKAINANVINEDYKFGDGLADRIIGNIDTAQRQVLEWNQKNASKFKDALSSWGDDVNDYLGSYSTVDSRSEDFYGVEIAFTPIFNGENGPEYLDKDTVNNYIEGLIQAAENTGKDWANDKSVLLNLDKVENGGKGLLFGQDLQGAEYASHFAGALGSIADAEKAVTEAAKDAGLSVNNFLSQFNVGSYGINKQLLDVGDIIKENFDNQKQFEEFVTNPKYRNSFAGTELYDAYVKVDKFLSDNKIAADTLLETLREIGSFSGFSYDNYDTSFKMHHQDQSSRYVANQADLFNKSVSSLDYGNQSLINSWGDQNWEQYDTFFQQYKEAGLNTQTAIRAAVVATNNLFKEQVNALKEESEEIKSWDLKSALDKFNIDETAFDDYLVKFRELNKLMTTSQESVERAAVAHYAFDTAINDLRSNLEGYQANLKELDRGCIEFGNSAQSLAKDLTAIVGIDFTMDDAISFVQSAENVDLLTQALDGSNEALTRLRANAVQETIISVDADINTDEFNAQFNELVSFIAENPDIGKFEAETYLDSSPFIKECINLINQGKMTADELQAIFTTLGWNIDFDYKEVPIKLPKINLSGNSAYEASKQNGGKGYKGYSSSWDGSYVDVPVKLIDNIRFNDKRTAPKSPSPAKTGGGGGGGGGSHTPTEHTPKDDSMDKAADAMQDAADAARDAFEQEKKNAEDLINITWFDWIERLLNTVEKKVNKWTKTVDRMFSYWNKNWAINNAIKENRNLMTVNSKAYTYYMKQANKAAKKAGRTVVADDEAMTLEIVGGESLQKKYRKDVATGKISVEEFNGTANSQKTYKKLQAYIEWYDKAQQVKDALEDLYDTEQKLIEQKLTNILDYYKTLENYFESFSAKLDSLISVKEASGQRISLEDVLNQYGANSDSVANLEDAYLAYRLGYNEENKRSAEEIQKDLEQFNLGLVNSDFYKTLSKRNEELQAKQDAYDAKQEEISNLKQQIANETDKTTKKDLKKQLTNLKKEAKKLKLTKTETKDWKTVKKQLETLSKDTVNGVVNNVLASTGAYQRLITDISNLESKNKLSKDQETRLAMLRDELSAINQGVLVDQLDNYISVYQKWWKLNNKLNTKGVLTKKENLQYKELEEQKTQMELAFQSQKQALQEELETVLQYSGASQQDLDRGLNQQKTEINNLYSLRRSNTLNSYKTNSKYQEWLQKKNSNEAAIQTQQQTMAAQQKIMNENKSSSKKYKEAKKKYDAAQKKLTELQATKAKYDAEEVAFQAGATDVNFAEYKKAYETFTAAEEYKSKHGKYKNKQMEKDRDAANNKLVAWQNQKKAELDIINRELADTLNRIQKEYEQNSNEAQKNIADQQAKGWEYVRTALELQMKYLEQDIANYEAMVSRYQTIAKILSSTDMNTIEEYDLAEILGIDDTSSSIGDLISDNILSALNSAKDKLSLHSSLYDIYGTLIEAAENQDFSSVITDEFANSLSEQARKRLKEMLAKANTNDWDGNAWVQEWASARAQVISDVASTIDAIQELKDTLRESVVFKATQDAIESLENLNNRLSSMSNIINNDWVQDEDGLTEYGRAKIMLLANEAKNAQDIVQNAAKHIQEVQDAQLNENTRYATEEEYQKALTDAWSDYSNALQNVYSIDNEIYELSKKQQEAEVNRLSKVIDLRKKALANKKAYYDYDKTIKSKTKNIEALEAELKALNGVNDAASKARIKQLQSDLADAREDLEDTKKEHEYDMQINALDKLLEDYSESLDNSAKSIKDTFEQWAQQIRDAIDASSGVDVNKALNDILSFMMTVPDNDGSNSSGQQSSNTDASIHLYDPEGVYSGNTTPSTVASDISVGNLVSLTDTQISNNYLEKLVEMSSMAQNTLNDIVSNTQSITNKLFESSIDVIPKYEDVYSSRLYDTVQSIDSKFNGSMSDLINATNKAGNLQQISLTLPKNMSTSQLNNLFNQLRKLGVNFVYK